MGENGWERDEKNVEKMCLSMGKIMANLFLEHFVTWDVLFYLQIFIMSVGRARTFLCFF